MKTNGERLERYNVVLSRDESEWLDQFVSELHTENGAKISRSEVVRAAIDGLRELHSLAPEGGPSWFPPLTRCRSGAEIGMLAVVAARAAAQSERA